MGGNFHNVKASNFIRGKETEISYGQWLAHSSPIQIIRFWKCWKSKFDKGSGSSRFIDGLTDGVQTAEAFIEHFRKTCTSFNDDQNTHLQSIYQNRRQNYVGDPFIDDYKFDVELIEDALTEMKRGKAAGLDELTVKHVVHSHPVLIAILAKLFNVIMFAGYVPHGFRLSYTVYQSPR